MAPSSSKRCTGVRRGLDIPDGGTIDPAIDFNSSEAIAAATALVTVTGLEPGHGTVLANLGFTNGKAGADIGHFHVSSSSGPKTFDAVPASLLEPDDLQTLSVSTSTASESRLVHRFFRSVVDQELTLGPALANPTVTSGASTPSTRPRVQLPVQPEYNQALYVLYDLAQRGADLTVTAGYLGNPSAWDVTIPDLSEATGWNNDWGLPPDDPSFAWTVIGLGGSWPFLTDPGDGATARSASQWSTTPAVREAKPGAGAPYDRGRHERLAPHTHPARNRP